MLLTELMLLRASSAAYAAAPAEAGAHVLHLCPAQLCHCNLSHLLHAVTSAAVLAQSAACCEAAEPPTPLLTQLRLHTTKHSRNRSGKSSRTSRSCILQQPTNTQSFACRSPYYLPFHAAVLLLFMLRITCMHMRKHRLHQPPHEDTSADYLQPPNTHLKPSSR
jgi:hypothetical protein